MNRDSNHAVFDSIRPFESESEMDSETESGYSDYTGSGSGSESDSLGGSPREGFVPPDRAELYRIGNPKITAKALDNTITANTNYATFKKSGAEDPLFGKTEIDFGKTEFKMAPKERQTMILVDSLNRDRTAYPQPTSLQLHLPRVYRNITSIAIQQLKLLTSFLYFRHNKYNTYFDILEEGRIVPGTSDPNILRVNIREGSYSLDQLLQELLYQMNTTPTFYYFSDGFNDFVRQFSATGDLSLNFNLPGDYYYDALLEKYIPNPSMEYIVTRYFATRNAGQSSYTVNELQNAYYYPVLKEAFLDPDEFMKLVLPTTGEDVYTRVVYGFEGLNDTYTYDIIKDNLLELDRYRTSKTFANALVNKYSWTSNSFNKRVNVSASGLNTSIVNDINLQSNIYLSNAIMGVGGFSSIGTYNTYVSNAAKINAIATDMYNFLQTQLATYFGVNIGTYGISTLASSNDYYFIQNGSNVEGVYTSYSVDYVNARNSNLLLSNLDFNYVPSSPIVQWPNMVFGPTKPTIDVFLSSPVSSVIGGTTVLNSATWFINSNAYQTQNIYDFTLSNFDSNIKVTTSTGIINASLKYGSADIVTNISSGQYAIIPIRSDARQLLQVETTPRPYTFRYKDFNAINYGGLIPFFFNKDYEYTTSSSIGTSAGSNSIFINIDQSNYGKNRDEISSIGPFVSTYTLNVLSNYKYFQINVPQPSTGIYGTDAVGFDYQLQLEIDGTGGSTIVPTLGVYLYHDRAAFMADAGQLRSENPLNYLSSYHFSSVSSFVESIRVLGGNDYYLIVRPDDVNFQTTRFNLYTYWNDTTSTPRKLLSNFNLQQPGVSTFSEQYDFVTNGVHYSDTPSTVNYFFYKTYNSNYIRLPISTTTATPSDAKFNTVLTAGGPVIGYDVNKVSNDLTDYKTYVSGSTSFVPGAQFGADPSNKYFFNNLSPYNSTINVQSYFYEGTSNAILTSTTLAPYTPTYLSTANREYKIVQYYDPTYIGPQLRDASTGWTLNPKPCTFTTMSPYTSTTTNGLLSSIASTYSYTYDSQIGVSTLKVGEGIYGITFLPTEGVWDVTRFSFKSAYMGLSDPNDLIEYIGIFDTNSITNRAFPSINPRGALAVLRRTGKIVYDTAVRASTANFDPSYGTWYNFEYDDSFPYSRPDLVDQGLPGYTPYPCTIVAGEKNIYSAIAFKSDYTVTSYFMLTGSCVPFPADTTPKVSSSYLGFKAPNNTNVVVPTAYAGGKSYINNIYQSQYAQSIPIGTQGINYGSTLNLINDEFALKNYNPIYGMGGNPGHNLRTANYFEGSNQYLLFGDPTGVNTSVCDMYLVRNPGTSNRDTAYYSTMNLSNIIPLTASEQIITWTANSDSMFAMTKQDPLFYNWTPDVISGTTPLILTNSIIKMQADSIVKSVEKYDFSSNNYKFNVSVSGFIPRFRVGFESIFLDYLYTNFGDSTNFYLYDAQNNLIGTIPYLGGLFLNIDIQFTSDITNIYIYLNGILKTTIPIAPLLVSQLAQYGTIESKLYFDGIVPFIFLQLFFQNISLGPLSQNNITFYELSSLSQGPTCALHQQMPMDNMVTWYATSISFNPLFNTSICKLYFNDNKDWIYSDSTYSSADVIYQRGFIQYNNTPIQSTFTAAAYDIAEFRDIGLHVNASTSYYTQYAVQSQLQGIQRFYLSTPNASITNINGLIFTDGSALASNTIEIVPPYSQNVKKIIPNNNALYVLSDNVPTRYLRVDGTTLTASATSFDPGYLATSSFGYGTDKNGGLWFSLQTGNNFASTPITIYGNTQLGDDIGVGMIGTAYQIFYPTMKIGLTRKTNRYNDITNTIDFNYFGSTFYEYPKTQAFFYPNFSTLLNDVMSTNASGSTVNWKWGQEKVTNYFRADTEFQGFGYNSYIYNIPLSTNGPLTASTNRHLYKYDGNPNDYSYLAIRGYSPSEDFQVMVRLNCPNRYDYGTLNNQLLIGEISTAAGLAGTNTLSNWNPYYVNDLSNFNIAFSTTQVYGEGIITNFLGSTITTTNYSTFYNNFSTIYGQYITYATVIGQVNSSIAGNLFSYLSTNYGEIIPLSTLYSHARVTDALQFDPLFSTSVAPQASRRDTDWGLGYNLGFARSNYSGLTSYSAPTFYKILDDYIYLQLNESLSMNVLDTTNRENLSTTQESTGEVRKYFSKLLLGNYGNYSQTVIGTTVSFNPPVGKLDKFVFNWVDFDGNVIDNLDCDWSAVLLVNEQDQVATAESSLAKR